MTLINKIVLGAAGATALIVLSGILWLKMSNLRLKAEVAEAEMRLAAYRMANDSLAEQINKQNTAFERLHAEGERQRRLAEVAAEQAKKKAQKYLDEADALRRRSLSGDACAAANSLFDAYLEEAK